MYREICGNLHTGDSNKHVAKSGTLQIDIATGIITIHDGITPGGISSFNLDSLALTGTPTAPTADSGTITEQLATTAFVASAVSDNSELLHIFFLMGA